VIFPEEEGRKCLFPFLFLHVVTKRFLLSWQVAYEKDLSSKYSLARGFLGGPEEPLDPAGAAKRLREVAVPEDVGINDMLVLYGPQGDLTVLSPSIAFQAAYWLVLSGDLFALGLPKMLMSHNASLKGGA
jgi:hypothetical protein